MPYMLDTNIVSDMVRNPDGAATRQFARVGQHNVSISIIVAAELRLGALKSGSIAKLDDLLNRLAIVPFESPADQRYAEIRLHLERAGTPIGANDMLIAAHALELGRTLERTMSASFHA